METDLSAGPSRPYRPSPPSSPHSPSPPTSTAHPHPHPQPHARGFSSFDRPYADALTKRSLDMGSEMQDGRQRADSVSSDDEEVLLHRPAPIAGHDEDGEPPAYSGVEQGGHRGGGGGAGHGRAGSIRSMGTMSLEERKRAWWKNTFITGLFIVSWYCFATILAVYNKWMFSADHYGFGYPLFVTFCHMVVQSICAAILRKTFPKRFRPAEKPTRQDYVSKVFPTAAATAGDVGLSNVSLKIITLSLYTMCKSSALIFVLFFAFLLRLEAFSLRLLAVICLISFGVFCMVYRTTTVSVAGVLMVFSASFLSGARWGMTEVLMHKKAMGMSNPFATIYWLAPLMALTLAVVSLALEGWGHVFTSGFFEGSRAIVTILVIILPGLIAFSMVASEFFIIQRAGIVPMSIAGIFKEVSTISISAWVFGDQLTELNIVGVLITVSGIALYSYHKYQKSVHSPEPLDEHGRPIKGGEADAAPLVLDEEPHVYTAVASAGAAGRSDERSPLAPHLAGTGVDDSRHGMLAPRGAEDGESGQAHDYPPSESPDKRSLDHGTSHGENGHVRLRTEDDADEDVGNDEVQRQMQLRGPDQRRRWFDRSWGQWWDKAM